MKRGKIERLLEFKSEKGLTMTDLLFVLFLGLKLHGSIQWAWIWVFMPPIIDYSIMAIVLQIEAARVSRMVKEEIARRKEEGEAESGEKFKKEVKMASETIEKYTEKRKS